MESNAHARTPPTSNPAHRASTRYSTFSLNAPTLAPSIAPSHVSRDGRSPTPTEKAPRSHSAHRHHHHKQHPSDSAASAAAVPRSSSAPTSAPGSSAGSTSASTTGGWDGTVYSVRAALARLEEPRLSSQRYVVSEEKRTEFGALALAAKLEKALGRRMSGQDASFSSAPRSRSSSSAAAAGHRKKVGAKPGSISLADAPGVSRVTARALKA